jgi:hypothetical protein
MVLEEVETEGNNLSHSFDDWILNQNQLGKFRETAYVCIESEFYGQENIH